MSFLYKGISVSPPPGTIVQYMGNSDPDGWLICDGVQRTTNDGRYQDLNSILVPGISDPNKCTPPNLKGKFLYGASSTSIGLTGGSTTKSILVENLPSHTHGVTDGKHTHGANSSPHTHVFNGNQHSHTATDSGHTHIYYTAESTAPQSGDTTWCYNGGRPAQETTTGYANITVAGATAGGTNQTTTASVTVDSANSNITIDSTGSGNSLDIMPPYFVINHIIKY